MERHLKALIQRIIMSFYAQVFVENWKSNWRWGFHVEFAWYSHNRRALLCSAPLFSRWNMIFFYTTNSSKENGIRMRRISALIWASIYKISLKIDRVIQAGDFTWISRSIPPQTRQLPSQLSLLLHYGIEKIKRHSNALNEANKMSFHTHIFVVNI